MLPAIRISAFFVVLFSFAAATQAATMDEVREVISRLDAATSEERFGAAVRLGEFGSNGNIGIEALIRTAKHDPDHTVRMQAIRALERISGQANLTVMVLVDLLSDPDPEIRWAVAGALESFGLKASIAVPELIHRLEDPDRIVREAASATLGKMGPVAVAALMRVLDEPSTPKRVHALKALAALGARAGVSVPRVIALVDDEDSSVRRAAILALRRIAGDRNWPGESGWLTDPKDNIWPKAMTSAERNRDYPSLRAAILESVSTALVRLARDEDPEIRLEAARGFTDIGPDAIGGAAAVAPLLFDSNPFIRRTAADALGAMGEAAVTETAPDLVSALGDPDDHVVWAAVGALRNGGDAAIAEILVVLKHGDPALLPGALAAVIEIGPAAREVSPALVAHLDGDDPHIRTLAAEALGSVGELTATGVLRAALEDDAPGVREAAAWALAEIGTSP